MPVKFIRQGDRISKVLKRAAMGKDVTIVTFANRISLIKTFSGPDLKVKPFKIGKDFMTSEGAVFELKSFAEVLQRHQSTPNTSFLAIAIAKAEWKKRSLVYTISTACLAKAKISACRRANAARSS